MFREWSMLSFHIYDSFLLILQFPFSFRFRPRSAKKGKDAREQLAEVRPDPDIEDVDRDVAETSRSGELFALRVPLQRHCFVV